MSLRAKALIRVPSWKQLSNDINRQNLRVRVVICYSHKFCKEFSWLDLWWRGSIWQETTRRAWTVILARVGHWYLTSSSTIKCTLLSRCCLRSGDEFTQRRTRTKLKVIWVEQVTPSDNAKHDWWQGLGQWLNKGFSLRWWNSIIYSPLVVVAITELDLAGLNRLIAGNGLNSKHGHGMIACLIL